MYYDSPGSDRGSNTSLNAEYVQVRNTTSAPFQMKGYTLRDASGHKYTFPSYKISAGKTVKVHTGKGTQSPGNLYQGCAAYVWNNTSDKASLYTAAGTLWDSCSYNSSIANYKMC
ncbi:MAG: lamin tail domain-containing protein [Streptomyces sp.]